VENAETTGLRKAEEGNEVVELSGKRGCEAVEEIPYLTLLVNEKRAGQVKERPVRKEKSHS